MILKDIVTHVRDAAVLAYTMAKLITKKKPKTKKYHSVAKPINKQSVDGRSSNMGGNSLENFIRDLVKFVEELKDGVGMEDITGLVNLIMSGMDTFPALASVSTKEKESILVEALDGVLGKEEGALIGPNGKIKLDIPIVDDELVYDAVIRTAVSILSTKLLRDNPEPIS